MLSCKGNDVISVSSSHVSFFGKTKNILKYNERKKKDFMKLLRQYMGLLISNVVAKWGICDNSHDCMLYPQAKLFHYVVYTVVSISANML